MKIIMPPNIDLNTDVIKCLACGSTDVKFNKKTQIAKCRKCKTTWSAKNLKRGRFG